MRLLVNASALAAALVCTATAAHATAPASGAAGTVAAPAAPSDAFRRALHLDDAAAPVVARYAVSVRATAGAPAKVHRWDFVREPGRVALIKGNIEEHWLRDEAGRIRFERVLHERRAVAEYSAGELATLGIEPQWSALERMVDPQELVRLKVTRHTGQGAAERVELVGRSGAVTLHVTWSPALQLPTSIERRGPAGELVSMKLRSHAPTPRASGPASDPRIDDYARIDAADFGDMPYDATVRVAEAIDVRSGWRRPHAHD
jgi:hypothetical protein